MIVLVSLIAKGTSCVYYFPHGASLHCHSFENYFTLISYILLRVENG